jgi:hypothetical protein
MNPRSDMQAEMRNSLPDVHTLERLLGGRVEPDDAPPGYAEVARVLKAVATLPGHVDLNREDEDIAAARMLVAQQPPASGRSHGSSQRMRSNRHRVRVFGLVVLGTVLGTFGFAAAGALPDTPQDALSNVLAHVGISVPRSDHLELNRRRQGRRDLSDRDNDDLHRRRQGRGDLFRCERRKEPGRRPWLRGERRPCSSGACAECGRDEHCRYGERRPQSCRHRHRRPEERRPKRGWVRQPQLGRALTGGRRRIR